MKQRRNKLCYTKTPATEYARHGLLEKLEQIMWDIIGTDFRAINKCQFYQIWDIRKEYGRRIIYSSLGVWFNTILPWHRHFSYLFLIPSCTYIQLEDYVVSYRPLMYHVDIKRDGYMLQIQLNSHRELHITSYYHWNDTNSIHKLLCWIHLVQSVFIGLYKLASS